MDYWKTQNGCNLNFHTKYIIYHVHNRYISPNPAHHRAKLFAFRELVQSFMPNTSKQLDSLQALKDDYLNAFFVDLFDTILPFPYVCRILDAFLLEGNKILHRFGLGLITKLKQLIKMNTYPNADEFWNAMRIIGQNMTDREFQALCDSSFSVGQPVVSRLVGPKSFSRTQVNHKEQKGLRALGAAAASPLSIFSRFSQPKSANNPFQDSVLLSSEYGTRLRSLMVDTFATEEYKLMFSTSRDGWDLETLYRRTQSMSPCVLLLKSVESKALFGMFLSVALSPASKDIRGDGQCFLFRLDGQKAISHRWAAEDLSVSQQAAASNDVTLNQFAVCNEGYMLFGGSSQHGTNAIRVETDLKYCECGPSDTYGNSQSIVPEEAGRRFLLAEIEVLCGSRSVEAALGSAQYQKKATWSSERNKK